MAETGITHGGRDDAAGLHKHVVHRGPNRSRTHASRVATRQRDHHGVRIYVSDEENARSIATPHRGTGVHQRESNQWAEHPQLPDDSEQKALVPALRKPGREQDENDKEDGGRDGEQVRREGVKTERAEGEGEVGAHRTRRDAPDKTE